MSTLSALETKDDISNVVSVDISGGHVPKATSRVQSFFARNNIWSIFSTNRKATSCKEAALSRYRLGARGIPLGDELKSSLLEYKDIEEKTHYIAAHCRADDSIDFSKIVAYLKVKDISRVHLTPEDKDIAYGLVNPVALAEGFRGKMVLQIFDAAVLEYRGEPGTMMTNAGDFNWAVEFYPDQLIEALGHLASVVDIIEASEGRAHTAYPIGILTGNAPDLGILLWQLINEKIRQNIGDEFRGDLSFPPARVHSAPELGLSMELEYRAEKVWYFLQQGIKSLIEQGAKLICLACNTTHYFEEQIAELCNLEDVHFISMAQTVQQWAKREQIKKLTLVGIPYVADLGPWSAYNDLQHICDIERLSDNNSRIVNEIAYDIKQHGPDGRSLNKFNGVIRNETGDHHIIFALTEISILRHAFRNAKKGNRGRQKSTTPERPIADTLDIYADEICRVYLSRSRHR